MGYHREQTHARMLGDVGVITKEEAQMSIAGLDESWRKLKLGL